MQSYSNKGDVSKVEIDKRRSTKVLGYLSEKMSSLICRRLFVRRAQTCSYQAGESCIDFPGFMT